jgi:hypothetical protein
LDGNKKHTSNNGAKSVENEFVARNFKRDCTGDDDKDPSWENGADEERSKATGIFAPMKQDGKKWDCRGESRKDIHYHQQRILFVVCKRWFFLPLIIFNSGPFWYEVDDGSAATKYYDCENHGRNSAFSHI